MLGIGSLRPFRPGSPRSQNQEASFGCILMVAVPFLFFISCFFVWQDVKYALYSKSIDAQVERTFETVDANAGHRRGKPMRQVEYSFRDAITGEERTEADMIPLRWPRPAATVSIDYLPGQSGESRVSGNRSYLALLFFAGCGLATTITLGILYREARNATRESESIERKRRREH